MIIAIFLAGTSIFGQTTQPEQTSTEKKNQLCIGYFNVFSLSSINDFGIVYKHNIKNGALRIGTAFYFNNEESTYVYNDNKITNKTLRIRPRVGYEFHRDFNKLQLLYSIDIIGSLEKYNAIHTYSSNPNNINNNNNNNNNNDRSEKTYMGGANPLIGLKYQISETFSISTETTFNICISRTDIKYKYANSNVVIESKTNGVSTGLSPLGIFSINIHF